jgi:hypothetical protein
MKKLDSFGIRVKVFNNWLLITDPGCGCCCDDGLEYDLFSISELDGAISAIEGVVHDLKDLIRELRIRKGEIEARKKG